MTRFVVPELPPVERLRGTPPLWLRDAHDEAMDHVVLIAEIGVDWCIYCGEPAEHGDHLVPRPVSGDELRHLVPIVPACAPCNLALCAFPSPFVVARAAFVLHRLRIKVDVAQAQADHENGLGDDEEFDRNGAVVFRHIHLESGGLLRAIRRGRQPIPNLNRAAEAYV